MLLCPDQGLLLPPLLLVVLLLVLSLPNPLALTLPLIKPEGPETRARLAARSDGEDACCCCAAFDAGGIKFQRPIFLWHRPHHRVGRFVVAPARAVPTFSTISHPKRDNASCARPSTALLFRFSSSAAPSSASPLPPPVLPLLLPSLTPPRCNAPSTRPNDMGDISDTEDTNSDMACV